MGQTILSAAINAFGIRLMRRITKIRAFPEISEYCTEKRRLRAREMFRISRNEHSAKELRGLVAVRPFSNIQQTPGSALLLEILDNCRDAKIPCRSGYA